MAGAVDKVGRLSRKKLLLFMALLLAAVAVAILFWLDQEEGPEQDLLEEVEVTVSVQGLELEHGSKGQKAWRLTAPESEYNQEQAVFYLQEPRLEMFSKSGQDTMLVQARQGRFDQDRQSALFSQGVEASYQDMRLKADSMQYFQNLDWMIFQGPVSASHPAMHVQGLLARFELQEERIMIQGQVQVQLRRFDLQTSQ